MHDDYGVLHAVVQRLQDADGVGKTPFYAQIHLGYPKTNHFPMVLVDMEQMNTSATPTNPKALVRLKISVFTQSLATTVNPSPIMAQQVFFLSNAIEKSLQQHCLVLKNDDIATLRLQNSCADIANSTKARGVYQTYIAMVW